MKVFLPTLIENLQEHEALKLLQLLTNQYGQSVAQECLGITLKILPLEVGDRNEQVLPHPLLQRDAERSLVT